MMPADARKYLWDAKAAVDRIGRFTAGKSLDDYLSDELLRSAVERQFEIIGEALAALRRTDAKSAVSIPEVGRIIAFRNVLIHGYATIDDRIVWGVIEGNLPELRSTLERMLGEADPT